MVIAIIALLISILSPALQRTKERVGAIICQSNLRQYGVAARMYLDGNEARFPDPYVWLYSRAGTGGTRDAEIMRLQPDGSLYPYLKDKDIHICPTFRMVARRTGRPNAQYSYGMNAYLGEFEDSGANRFGGILKETELRCPAGVFFFSEENTWTIEGLSDYVINDNNLLIGEPGEASDCFATYNDAPGQDFDKGSGNLVFVDGHVDSTTADEQRDGGNFRLAWPK